MNWQTILPLIKKDLTLFFRNRFYAMITILALVFYTGIYYAMPADVDEVIEVGLFAPAQSAQAAKILADDGITFRVYESAEAMKQAILAEEILSGIAFPENILESISLSEKPVVHVYLASDLDADMREIMTVMVEAISLTLTGRGLNIEANEIIIGRDMAGEQIPIRNRILPLFAIVILMFETMGLASLMAEEIQVGTIRALLVSPMGTREFFVAKGIISIGLVLAQACILMLAVGGFATQPLIVFTTLLLGAFLVTGIGFLMGAAGKDMLSVMSWGILAMIVLMVPSFGVIFPGLMTSWVMLIPSYYLVDSLHQVINFGAGWEQVANNMLILLVWIVVFLTAGSLILKRKFA